MIDDISGVSNTVDQIGFWISEHPFHEQTLLYGAVCYRIAALMMKEAERYNSGGPAPSQGEKHSVTGYVIAAPGPHGEKQPGAYAFGGKLFFKLLDGSTVVCDCIGEPFVSEIVAACRHVP